MRKQQVGSVRKQKQQKAMAMQPMGPDSPRKYNQYTGRASWTTGASPQATTDEQMWQTVRMIS